MKFILGTSFIRNPQWQSLLTLAPILSSLHQSDTDSQFRSELLEISNKILVPGDIKGDQGICDVQVICAPSDH